MLENAYNNNLVADIAKVDYLPGTAGKPTFGHSKRFALFVDDVYVFGYLLLRDVV